MNKIFLKIICSLNIFLVVNNCCLAQSSQKKEFTFCGYGELYYSYDFAKPANHNKENFMYNYKRHNEININIALAKVNYTKENVRGNFAVMIGNYAQYNLSAEPTCGIHQLLLPSML